MTLFFTHRDSQGDQEDHAYLHGYMDGAEHVTMEWTRCTAADCGPCGLCRRLANLMKQAFAMVEEENNQATEPPAFGN